ncbi:YadA-like family protein [Snodgrassella sp.]|uniref:YadA-like family protein n=1 Tax=Snodgrassella sp. TaxID=2815304 RepID=UPI00258663A9|nr:YadA-like family protein [Snodgrassella sp.]
MNISLLSATVYAANTAIIGGDNRGDNGLPQSGYKHASHGSVILNGANDFANSGNGTLLPDARLTCGADDVAGRGEPGRDGINEISALEEYNRFAENRAFNNKNPYGTNTGVVNANTAAMQGTLTGGSKSKMPVAYGVHSFASGCGSYTSGNYSVAFGTNATATAGGAMAIGTAALASGRASIAFGVGAEATGVSSVALGSVATSKGVGSVAAGLMSEASEDGTVALGVQAKAQKHSAVAIGNSAEATGEQSISIGSANKVSGKGSGAIGGSATTTLYDGVNGKTSADASGVTEVKGDGSYSFGNQNGVIAANNTGVFGNQNTIEIDSAGSDKADNVRILGNNNTVSAKASGAMIVGNAAKVSAADALALGNYTEVSGINGVAIGKNAKVILDNGVALGSDSVAATAKGKTGYNPSAGVTRADELSSSVWTSTENAVAIGNVERGITRQITGLAAGSEDTDAVNVAQLRSLDSSTSSSLSSLSSSTSRSLSTLNSNLSNLSLSTSTSISSVNSSLSTFVTSVDSRISTISTSLFSVSNSVSTSIQHLQEDTLQWNSNQQAYDAAHGGKAAKIINVEAGDTSAPGSTEAINGGQLYSTNTALSSLSSTAGSSISTAVDKFEKLSTSVNEKLFQSTNKLNNTIDSVSTSIDKLNRDALQLKNDIYDASRDGKLQKITNIAAGDTSSATSTDVVNGGQLFTTNSSISSLSTAITQSESQLKQRIKEVSDSVGQEIKGTNEKIKELATSTSNSIERLDDLALKIKGGVYDAKYGGIDRKITNVAAGDIESSTSSDVVIGAQLYTTNTKISTLSTNTATSLQEADTKLLTLSTEIDSKITTLSGALTQKVDNVSGSISTNNSSISVALSSLSSITATGIQKLKTDALQWEGNAFNASRAGSAQIITQVAAGDITSVTSSDAVNGGQLYTTNSNLAILSGSVSSGLSGLSDQLNTSTSRDIGSLSTVVSSINDSVGTLQSNALLWKNNAYDASHNDAPQKITNVKAGNTDQGSTDVINGGQLFSLSTATVTKLNDVKTSFSSELADSKAQITEVKNQALLWNSNITAYDARNKDGAEQKITGVARGDVTPNSSDVVIGAQLYETNLDVNSLSTSISGGYSSLSTALNSSSTSIINSLSTLVDGSQKDITALQKSALQWSSADKAYSAKYENENQRITNVLDGNLAPDSTDVVTGKQLYTLSSSTVASLSSLSTSLEGLSAKGLSSLSVALSNGLSTTNSDITSLQQDALQWNGKAYDASHGVANGVQKITNVQDATLDADSSDVVTGKQLFNTNTSISNLDNRLSNGLSSLSGSASSGLSDLSISLNKSLSSGLSSLSTAVDNNLSSTISNVSLLQKNALQWNGEAYDASHGVAGGKERITNVADASLSSGSSDVVTGGQLFTTNTAVSSLSTSLDSGLRTLSTTAETGLSNLSDNLNRTLKTGLGSLSTKLDNALDSTNAKVNALQKNALLWDGAAYDASHGGSAQRITNVEAGRMAADSTDAINGSQLFSLSNSTSTGLSSLSTNLSNITNNQVGSLSSTVSISLSTVNSHVSSLSVGLSTTNNNVTLLQQNTLQWNSSIGSDGAYDATRNGSAQKLTGIMGGDIRADSSDAINGAQMHSLSTLTQTGLNSTSTGLSSLSQSTSSGLNIVNTRLDSLSTVTQTGLSSTSTGLSSLSSGLSSTKQDLATLQANALQWNGGVYDASHGGSAQRITNVAAGYVTADSTDAINGSQLFSLSNSTSTGLSSLSTNLSSVIHDQLGSLSSIVADSLSTVNKNVSSLSTGLDSATGKVAALQKDALQWNGTAYDATRDGFAQKLTGITGGNISAGSSDAVNGAQMYSLSTLTQTGLNSTSTGLSSLSSSTVSGLNAANTRLDSLSTVTQAGLVSVSTGLSSLSLSTTTDLNNLTASLSATNQNLTSLQQNALQWNSSLNAYDASHNGVAQRISNVAAGRMAADSTDAINGSQLFSLSSSTSTGLNSLSTVISTTVISEINNISSSISTGYDSLSISLSTAKDGLDKLTSSTSASLSSLSTASQEVRKEVDYLKENTLQWNNDEGGFDAGKPNNLTRAPIYRKIINVEGGDIVEGSHEVVVGGQLFTVKSDLASLSTATLSSLSSITSKLQNTDISSLKADALQWNSSLKAYDASHGEENGKKKIINVAGGNIAKNSTDAVNAGQLWDVKNDLDNLTTRVNSLPTGNISHDALISLSTSISSSINSIASALGTPNSVSGGIVTPSYSTSATDGTDKTAKSVAEALNNIHNDGTKYAKINSAKAASAARGNDSIAIGGASLASGTAAIAIGNDARASETNAVALGNGAQVKQAGGVALGAGSVADRVAGKEGYIPVTATQQQADAIRKTTSKHYGAVSVGDAANGEYRQITGVAAGTEDTDAVNVAQLKGVNNQINNVNKYVNKVNERLQRTERRAYSGTALAMALSGAYLPSLNAGEQAVGVGVGNYRGYTAVGANYKAISNGGNIGWGAGVSTTGKEVGFNAGIGFKWSNN